MQLIMSKATFGVYTLAVQGTSLSTRLVVQR
jgi:hypothetical protein